MQKEFGDKIIPEEIGNVCFDFYFMERDRFHVNDDIIFEYDSKVYKNDYNIMGQHRVVRGKENEYEWKLEISGTYSGRLGIIDDTNLASHNIDHGQDIGRNIDVVCVGGHGGRYIGYVYGKPDTELKRFLHPDGDIITVAVSYINDTVTFKSQKNSKEIVRELREGINAVRFIALFGFRQSTMKVL